MNKGQIKIKLSKKYDELSSKMLAESVWEYQELFKEKYLSTNEVLKLLFANIPKGIVVYENLGKFDATCSMTDGEFKVTKPAMENKEYFGYVFFHEFLHAISFRKHNNLQFMGFYSRDKGEEYQFKATSFNEAVTEYMALKRNKMLKYKNDDFSLSGYEVGATEIHYLTNFIPERILLNSYFNCPDKLEDIFIKYNMNMDEVFYCIHAVEGITYDVKSLELRRALDNPQNVFKIIDSERILLYNKLDSFGPVENEEDFNKKWKKLLSEQKSKYNYFLIDGLFRYGELIRDMKKLKIKHSDLIDKKVSKETLEKYKTLRKIFDYKDPMVVLEKLSDIYHNSYKDYHELAKDDAASLAYFFLREINSNYQLYDIEIYPRIFPYLLQENSTIEKAKFRKIRCDEVNTTIFIFTIKGHNYIETNYDDTSVCKINNNVFELKYGEQVDKVDIKNNIYEINGDKLACKVIY